MSSSETSESISPSPENVTVADEPVFNNLLPSKSRDKYLKAYDNFVSWKNSKGDKTFSEPIFLNYFQELAKTKQPSTLWSIYSMLKCTASTNQNIQIQTYRKLTAYLKRLSEGYKTKKSKVFSNENIATFLNEAPDTDFLAIKVALIFGIHGACRGNELLNITVDDIENVSDQILMVKLIDTKTKIDRSFIIRGEYKIIVEKYQNLRPPDMKCNRFFIRYHQGKCFKQVIGKNTISRMPQEIARYLKLRGSSLYTGHCFRRTSAVLKACSGADLFALKRLGDWKSRKVGEGHKDDSYENNEELSSSIVESVKLESNPSSMTAPLSPQPSTSNEDPTFIISTNEPDFNDNQPDSEININTQTANTNMSTTISLPNKTVTIHFQNCPNSANIYIKF